MCKDDLNEPVECNNLGNSILSNQYHTDLVTDEVQINAASDKNPDTIFSFTNEMRVESNLLKLVTDMNIPIYAFKKIMDWAKDAYKSGYQFNPKASNYHSQIKQMESFSNLKSIRPHVKQIALQNSLKDPWDTTIFNVVCCDFTSMLLSLLQDKSINTEGNLVVNSLDYFAKYVSPNGKLSEVNSGSWYEHAYSTMI